MAYPGDIFFWPCKGGSTLFNGKIAKASTRFKEKIVLATVLSYWILHRNMVGRKSE